MSLIPPFNFSFFFWCPFFSELCLINPRLQGIDSSDGWMDGWMDRLKKNAEKIFELKNLAGLCF
jgi:hypothetical protein